MSNFIKETDVPEASSSKRLLASPSLESAVADCDVRSVGGWNDQIARAMQQRSKASCRVEAT